MPLNSDRDELLKQLHIASQKPWIGNITWNPELNQRILEWTGTYLIPKTKKKYYLFSLCRPQLIRIWKLFLKWLNQTGQRLDLGKIDPDILRRFKKELPELGWSASGIYLIEAILIAVRKHLYDQQILWCCKYVNKNRQSESRISIKDYRAIREYFLIPGNDYEIVYFELTAIDFYTTGILTELKGKNVKFKGDRAFIIPPGRPQAPYPCPRPMSLRLLKLLRSRNILAEEGVFDGIERLPRIFDKKIKEFCDNHNIPLYAVISVKRFLLTYMVNFSKKNLTEYKKMRPLIYPPDSPFC